VTSSAQRLVGINSSDATTKRGCTEIQKDKIVLKRANSCVNLSEKVKMIAQQISYFISLCDFS